MRTRHALEDMKKTLILATIGATLLAGCGSGDGDKQGGTSAAPAKATATTKIKISNFLYEPNPSVVKTGTKVSVTNADDAPHTLTDKGTSRTFDSGTVKGGEDGTVTFSKPGTYAYFCEFHPTMAGKVTVTE